MVFEFDTPGIARIVAGAGAEFVVFDQEHTGWGIDTIRALMATARAADVVPLVRVPATEYHFIARPLDAGASGVMVPMVETEEQARLVVSSAKYPPQGDRGAAFGIAHDDYEASGDAVAAMQQRERRDAHHRPDRDRERRRERRGDRGRRGARRALDRAQRPDQLDGYPGPVRPPRLPGAPSTASATPATATARRRASWPRAWTRPARRPRAGLPMRRLLGRPLALRPGPRAGPRAIRGSSR